MRGSAPPLESVLAKAAGAGQLRGTSLKNIERLLGGSDSGIYLDSVRELVSRAEWNELNDRFYRTLAFGTGGLRGRTIGKIVTTAERGSADRSAPPQFPCVGTNAMNFYNISRATEGLVAYVHGWLEKGGFAGKPKIVIAYDTRHFSREFAALAARVAAENGCDAFVFDSPRSTPELSFAVRQLRADAGIVITASHNPSHDNGYKVYFSDGAQVVEPHASGIIAKVNSIESETYSP
ncbi:MAG: phospho-sugar mutase, partial [Chthoniobacterales bacterium]